MLYVFLCIALLILFGILKVITPKRRFFSTANTAIDVYHKLQEKLNDASIRGVNINSQKIIIEHSVYNFKFENIEEAYRTIEKWCNEALNNYTKILNMDMVTRESEIQKNKLIDICNKIRMERWIK